MTNWVQDIIITAAIAAVVLGWIFALAWGGCNEYC